MQDVEKQDIFYDTEAPRTTTEVDFDSGGSIERDARRQNIQIQGVLGGGMGDNIAPYADMPFQAS
jgi:hypothetical protein